MEDPRALRAAYAMAAVTAVAFVGLIVALPGEGTWIADCGNKALVAQRLIDTNYRDAAFDYPAARFDQDGVGFPIRGFAVERGGRALSVFPLAYPVIASPLGQALGPDGLRLPAALGLALCAALFVLWAAPAVGVRSAAFGAGVLVFATPLAFYGATIWEHTLVVAVGLRAFMMVREGDRASDLGAGFVLGLACWLREETALLALALALAVARQRPRRGAFVAVGTAIPGFLLLVFNTVLYGSPLGGHVLANLEVGSRTLAEVGRQLAALLGGLGSSGAEAALLTAAALLAPAASWLATRERPAAAWVATVVALAAWLVGFTAIVGAERPIEALVSHNGLLLQLPLWCAAGAGLRALRAASADPLRAGVAASLGFAVLGTIVGLWSQRTFGYGVHWGPRMLLPLVPAVVALALVAARAGALPRVALGALAVAGLLSAGLGIGVLREQRIEGERLEALLRARPEPVLVSLQPFLPQTLPSLWDDKPWVRADDARSLRRVVDSLRRSGAPEFALVTAPGAPVLSWIDGVRCRSVAHHRGRRVHYLDADLQACGMMPDPHGAQ